MRRTWLALIVLSAVSFGLGAVPSPSGAAVHRDRLTVTAIVPATLHPSLPVVRLTFSSAVRAASLPPLTITPALATTWQQVAPNEVQAVATGAVAQATTYEVSVPDSATCAGSCEFTATTTDALSTDVTFTWEDQLLSELHYLPVTFTPGTPQVTGSTPVNGTYTWEYPDLPPTLQSQWSVGQDNVILQGALRTFQSQHDLPVTGEIDTATWNELRNAANVGDVDPATYNYVDVTETLPETLTLYVAGQQFFQTLVNTGVAAAPTALGTYPVYERFTSTTMTGTNPDGSHYSDPGIPWVSYFHGGDALHGFIRATYGWPQSDGCVEMPFASAKTVFPYTPIGTLVTVRA